MLRDPLSHGSGCSGPVPFAGVGAIGPELGVGEAEPVCDVAEPGTGRGNGRGAGVGRGRGRGRGDSGSGKGASGAASVEASAEASAGVELEERPTCAYTVMGADSDADSGEELDVGEETTSVADVLLSNWSLLRSMGPTRGSGDT